MGAVVQVVQSPYIALQLRYIRFDCGGAFPSGDAVQAQDRDLRDALRRVIGSADDPDLVLLSAPVSRIAQVERAAGFLVGGTDSGDVDLVAAYLQSRETLLPGLSLGMVLGGHQLQVCIASGGGILAQIRHIDGDRTVGLGHIAQGLKVGQLPGEAGSRGVLAGDPVVHRQECVQRAILQNFLGIVQIVEDGVPVGMPLPARLVLGVAPVSQASDGCRGDARLQRRAGGVCEEIAHLFFQVIVLVQAQRADGIALAALCGGPDLQIVCGDGLLQHGLVVQSILLVALLGTHGLYRVLPRCVRVAELHPADMAGIPLQRCDADGVHLINPAQLKGGAPEIRRAAAALPRDA